MLESCCYPVVPSWPAWGSGLHVGYFGVHYEEVWGEEFGGRDC